MTMCEQGLCLFGRRGFEEQGCTTSGVCSGIQACRAAPIPQEYVLMACCFMLNPHVDLIAIGL